MRIAAIYDIHANLSALEAVLQEIRQAKVDVSSSVAMFFQGRCRVKPSSVCLTSTFRRSSSTATATARCWRRCQVSRPSGTAPRRNSGASRFAGPRSN